MTSGYLYADSRIEGAVDDELTWGLGEAQSIMTEMVYMQPSTYEDRRTGDMLRALDITRFQSGTAAGMVYISRQHLEKYYPPYVEWGTMYFHGRFFWEATKAVLRSHIHKNMDEARMDIARTMSGAF